MTESRVLVVDDDDDIRALVRTLLERGGIVVRDAPNGREGLREFHAWRPDLVVLDVSMPELDGWNVLERIRDMSDVPVIMLTARGDELERVRGLQSGADDYVVKPFGKQEIVARVQALLRRATRGGARHRGRPRCAADAARVPAAVDVRPQPAAGVEPGPAPRARLGRHVRRRRRPGEALRRLSAPQARSGRARCRADRDRARIRLSLQGAELGVLEELADPRRKV